jgi:signal transduction histidine kinase
VVNGSGRIWIRTSQEPGRLLVEIADDGPGVPEEVQPHVFEPIFTPKDVGEGTVLVWTSPVV